MTYRTRSFMTVDFVDEERAEIRALLARRSQAQYSYFVTPNVDDLVKTLGARLRPHESQAFLLADIKICDSNILKLLSRLVGKPLVQYPGSDLVRDSLEDPAFDGLTFAVVGPDAEAMQIVRERYPSRQFLHIEVPTPLRRDTEAWDRCIAQLREGEWDIALLCLPLPRQQLIAVDLRAAGRERGVAMCVGASVDFLSGRQQRAPSWMQSLGLEWLYRLLSNPRRMWRRYLVEGPAILPIFFKTEIQPRLSRS